MIIIKILMLILLGLAARQDLKTQLVSDALMLPFCGLGILLAVFRGDFVSAAAAAILVIAVIFTKENRRIGGADLLLVAGFTAYFGIYELPNLLIYVCTLSLAIYAAEKILKISFVTKNGGVVFLVPSFLVFVFYLIWR